MLPNDDNETFYKIALSLAEGFGPKTVRVLLEHFPVVSDVFKAPPKELRRLEGITEVKAKQFRNKELLARAEQEFEFVKKKGIKPLFMSDPEYPSRLLHCPDAPVLLFYKGNADMNQERMVAVIGTRKNTDYGARATEDLISGLAGEKDMMVVSGLALGIDTIAHRSSLDNNLPTIGVVGHSLDRIYPSSNASLASEMMDHGGLLSEFPSGTKPSRQNFPVRNRVVAGMTDVTVLVESEVKGGAMITCYVAHSYNREVAAFPGRIYDVKSSGPNHLLGKNIAAMIRSADELLELMNWGKKSKSKSVQKQLFVDLSEEEKSITSLLENKDSVHADDLLNASMFSYPQLASVLLQLELKGIIKSLPGKNYRLN
jgi:DNA processing protein